MLHGYSKPCLDLEKERDRMIKDCSFILNKLKMYTTKSLSELNLLDIGCGNGFYVFGLSNYFHSIYGLDPSIDMLKSARNYNKNYFKKKNIRFYLGCVENNIFSKNFDIILFSYSLHLTINPYNSLLIISKNIQNNGILIIIEPNKEFCSDRLKPDSGEFDKGYYDNKQRLIKKTRIDIYKFAKNHIILYELLDIKWFIIIIRISG